MTKEEEATVRKDKKGKYYDFSKRSLVRQGKKRLTDGQFFELFSRLRLRFTLTPQCNLWCIFCSNEGLNYTAKKMKYANIDQIIKLSDILLNSTSLKSIDFSGGEPLIHPDFVSGEMKLLKWTKKYPNTRFSIHTNGINLTKIIVDNIKDNFSRIGITINSTNFDTWNKMTNLKNIYSKKLQKKKYNKLMNNIDYLASLGIGEKVFIKTVVMRGINDSMDELKSFMDFCLKYNFHPKLLEFEPQYYDQKKYVVGRKELFAKLEKIGIEFSDNAPRHNDPNTYIPGVNFKYKKAPGGLHSIFGCGLKAACESCYDFLCMFVKPTDDGRGLYLKPCSVLDTRFDLTHALDFNNIEELLSLFWMSREYLMLAPGLGCADWNKEEKYK